MRLHFVGLVCIVGMLFAVPGVEAQEGGSTPSMALNTLWVLEKSYEPTLQVHLEIPERTTPAVAQQIPFSFYVHSNASYGSTYVRLTVLDEQKQVVKEGILTVDLHQGKNTCSFMLDTETLPVGVYQTVLEVDYTEEYKSAYAKARIKKVTQVSLEEELAQALKRLASVRESLLQTENSETAPLSPYLAVRIKIADHAAKQAQQLLDTETWRQADATISYLKATEESLAASSVWRLQTPELQKTMPKLDLSKATLRNGNIYVDDTPVFLFGRMLASADPGTLETLAEYGFNWAVFDLPPSDTLSSLTEVAPFQQTYDPLFRAAQDHNISLTVQLAPERLGTWALDTWPNLKDKGFVDLAQPGVKKTYLRHLEAALPYLAQQSMVNSVSLARSPRFKFDGEVVRQNFIELVKEQHPDRQKLNRLWHAHLASYDEITIWDEDAPAHTYPNRRAYQYDWQQFHRSLSTAFFSEITEAARHYAPDLPLHITLPDAAFDKGESRWGIDRDMLAKMMDAGSCSATTNPKDSYYAVSYPRQSVFYTLMHSLQPDKPMLNMDYDIVLNDTLDLEYSYKYVHSAIWDAVMSGLNAIALAEDTVVFSRPETLDAFATAQLDINRLAPIIVAFQEAQPDVAILYSDASKIFDDGVPHLESAWFAYEGCSFSGYGLRFISEEQVQQGMLDSYKVLVIPDTPALMDETFEKIAAFVENNGTVARVGTPIPYNPQGGSRHRVIRNTPNTVLVRGVNLPTEYLHAMDAAIVLGSLPDIPRPVNAFGYPQEGIKTRYVVLDGQPYLYLINIRKEPVHCYLSSSMSSGRDLILGRDVTFPMVVNSLEPMLIRLDKVSTTLETDKGKKKKHKK